MTKIAIVTHRTGFRTDVVFHGATDRAIEFYKSFSQPGEISLFVCHRADRQKKLKATEPDAEVRPPLRRKAL